MIHYHARMNFLLFFIMSVVTAVVLKQLASYSLAMINSFSKSL